MVYTIVVHLYAKDDQDAISKLQAKLKEASLVYSRDKETLSWFVMQDFSDRRAFTIVERYASESSQKYHLDNPYWQTFDIYVKPLLERPMDLRRLEELVEAGTSELDETTKVEKDEELWKKVEAHQSYRKEQGNY